ncbi:MAG: hypothetical protein ABR514_10965 [Chthoniobacterales bacterium]
MKLRGPWKWEELRHKLVLTPEEKRVIIFILAAFVLGLGTKCYRERHPQPGPSTDAKHPWRHEESSPASSAAAKRSPRKPRKKVKASPNGVDGIATSPSPVDSERRP